MMSTQLIELEEVNPTTIGDDQLENYAQSSLMLTQWTCGNMTICGCY
jgi:hypothetical protein